MADPLQITYLTEMVFRCITVLQIFGSHQHFLVRHHLELRHINVLRTINWEIRRKFYQLHFLVSANKLHSIILINFLHMTLLLINFSHTKHLNQGKESSNNLMLSGGSIPSISTQLQKGLGFYGFF